MGKSNCFTTHLHKVVVAGEPESFDSLFLVMEYMPRDLKAVFNDEKMMLKEEHVVVILYNMLCAAKFLHSANVVHRDIKPANVLIN